MSVSYKNYPVLSLLTQAGGWMEVNKILACVQRSLVNAYIYSANKAGSRVTVTSDDIRKQIRPRTVSSMNLFGFVDETRRIDTAISDLVLNTNANAVYNDFDTACPGTLDEAVLPDYLKNILDHLFTTTDPIDRNYYVFEADNFPFYKLRFKDKDTLVDFANKCRLEGVVYKHIENVEYDKCQGYVDDDDFGNITREKRIAFLADALRILPFAITPDCENKYLYHTPDDGRYLVLTEEEETEYAKTVLTEPMFANNMIVNSPLYGTYLTTEGYDKCDTVTNENMREFLSDEKMFDLTGFLKDCFENNVCDLLCRNKDGIVILIEHPVRVRAFPQDETEPASDSQNSGTPSSKTKKRSAKE